MKQKVFSYQSRLQSFGFAIKGIIKFLQQEPNARVHFVVTLMVFIASAYFKVSGVEIIALIIVAGFVWVAEIFNTAIEHIMDFVSPEYHFKVACIKDLAAGAVLVSAIVAAITGLVVFIPKIF